MKIERGELLKHNVDLRPIYMSQGVERPNIKTLNGETLSDHFEPDPDEPSGLRLTPTAHPSAKIYPVTTRGKPKYKVSVDGRVRWANYVITTINKYLS